MSFRTKKSIGILPAAFLLAVAALVGAPGTAQAQYFGRNKVQYDEFDFKVLKTPHFDIHFYPAEAEAVDDLARMAERWYERYARTFQHEFVQPKPLVIYADHPDFEQTNTLQGMIGEGTGGVTESLKNRVILPLTGSYHDTDHVLGHELVHAFQYNLAQTRSGAPMGGINQLPLWLIEGMAEYLSIGRQDPLTTMWLRDAIRRNDLPTIKQMTTSTKYFPYRFGEALWGYIGGVYGDDAVVDIYRRSLRQGWESALHSVLGIGSDTLSARWKKATEQDFLPLMEGRTPPGEAGTLLLSPATGAGQQNVSPSLSPDGKYVAFLSEKDLFSIDLYLADARTGEIVKKLSSASSDPHFDALRFIDSSVTWSPDGSQLAFVVFADGDNELVVVNTDNGDVERRIAVPEVGAIANPAWSPDGKSIVFTGMKGGISDLYLLDVESSAVRQLTNDKYADFQPAWSPDGRAVVFTSDRGPETDFDRLTYSNFELAYLDLGTGNVRVLPVFGDVRQSNPQFSPDGESVYFLSDQDGFSDIYRLKLATGEVFRVTRLATGVSGITAMSPAMSVAARTGTLAFSVFDQRQFHIYTLDRQSAESDMVTVAQTEPAPAGLLPPAKLEFPSRVVAYHQDPLTGLPPVGRFSTDSAKAYDPDLSLDYIGSPTVGVGTDAFGNYVGGGVSAFFSDMLGDRWLGVALQAQGTFKDIGGQIFYQNMKHRWNWGLGGGRTPYIYGYQGIGTDSQGNSAFYYDLYRIYLDQATGLLSYPFSTTRRVELSGGFTRYSFDHERQIYSLGSFGQIIGRQPTQHIATPSPLNLFQGSVALVEDNSNFGFTGPVRGGRYRLQVGGSSGTVNFATLLFDYRRYFNPVNELTFAFRGLHYGRYGNTSRIENSAFQPLFLGYETFIRGYSYNSFTGGECTQTSTGSCAEFDRLFGERLGVMNLEVRIPFTGTDRYGLINFPYLPMDLVGFFDGGMAWDETRPIDMNWNDIWNRQTTARIPVFSAGASARVNVMGAFVLEIYYAYPFQRPQKGWHWGVQLAPAW